MEVCQNHGARFIDKDCEVIINDMLKNDRLALKQIIGGESLVKDTTVEESFLKLVKARLLNAARLLKQHLLKK